MREHEKYHEMRLAGAEPENVYRKAKEEGMGPIVAIRMLRLIYGLGLVKAKSVVVNVDYDGMTLAEYQESFFRS